ncbi:hypothetical protein CpsigB_04380 [Corynebacterium pseudotuberculosis]|uniref:Uncharacterized protein n=1 Tax=Corynebacterium pseudotuberculosis (strain C231) TaxID=681645 RepID=D9QCA9_CORP2|nr:hypothetical protein CPFRC_08775 [Corynebacterium pseudotuberculosis FRC41]ADL11185.1 hypothetical protein CPC231_08775 [Corynebacterium pseudotuberculosis C231]ADL21599.1 hypothetical protein CP1002_04370 [Corynebacterium pseudotuberculosis 1002]ADO26994.1 hypothetical protein CPI19_08780 [Corynebacterium pseudotuberculosis I19]AEK93058.1 Hypothetical protein CpPAT10_1733 [Corynebacterium pseudotuberculosis PAT10]AEP70962.1 Hypothetical protein Cp4202_1722 [Corynebacterium pseudotuberculos
MWLYSLDFLESSTIVSPVLLRKVKGNVMHNFTEVLSQLSSIKGLNLLTEMVSFVSKIISVMEKINKLGS